VTVSGRAEDWRARGMDIFVGADTSQWQGEFKVIGEVAIFTGHDFATGWYQQCADQCNLHA